MLPLRPNMNTVVYGHASFRPWWWYRSLVTCQLNIAEVAYFCFPEYLNKGLACPMADNELVLILGMLLVRTELIVVQEGEG